MYSEKKEVWLKRICFMIFLLYMLFLMKIVLFKYTGIQKLAEEIVNGNLEGFRSFNLIPFRTFQEFGNMMANGEFYRGFVNLAGNIGVFIPLGYFLPLLFEKCRNIKTVILIGFTVSCIFEICQYIFYLGSTDVDDIILNVFGVISGIICYRWMKKLTKENASIQYTITIILSIIGFIMALLIAVNYFGLMFGVKNGAEHGEKFFAVEIVINNYLSLCQP